MKKLTVEEEIRILKEIIDSQYEYIDHGSSRAVYMYGSDIVKIALDEGGINQNKREIELFEQHGGEHLAEIYAVGKHIIIMEYIEELRCDADYLMYQGDSRYFYFRGNKRFHGNNKGVGNNKSYFIKRPICYTEREKKILATCDFLSSINGRSGDSSQVGYNERGDIKAYDYGYLVGEWETSVGSIRDYGDYDNDYAFLEEGISRLEVALW